MKTVVSWCAALLLLAGNVHAQVNLRTVPVSPTAEQSFAVLATGGGCDGFKDPDPMAREVIVEGGVIRVIVPYIYTGFCVLPLVSVQWTLPGVPAGSYALELYGEDDIFRANLSKPSRSWWRPVRSPLHRP